MLICELNSDQIQSLLDIAFSWIWPSLKNVKMRKTVTQKPQTGRTWDGIRLPTEVKLEINNSLQKFVLILKEVWKA